MNVRGGDLSTPCKKTETEQGDREGRSRLTSAAELIRLSARGGASMPVEYFEDFEIGAEYTTHARTITETDIVTFVNLFGFLEPLFIDMEFVKNQSLFGNRIAPGSFTFALSEGLTIQSGLVRGGMALLGVQE